MARLCPATVQRVYEVAIVAEEHVGQNSRLRGYNGLCNRAIAAPVTILECRLSAMSTSHA
jgi:hypothetical protein